MAKRKYPFEHQEPVRQKSGPEFYPRGSVVGDQKKQGYGFIHPCWKPGCTASAPFGFGVKLLHNEPGLWACADHSSELQSLLREPDRRSVGTTPDTAVAAAHEGGDLFDQDR
jgi:hypothetical protein